MKGTDVDSRTRAGRLERQPEGYLAFIPAPLPPTDLRLEGDLLALLSRADLALGRLDGVVEQIPDPDLFLVMYLKEEAVLSSQIEGTQASLVDVLEFEANIGRAYTQVDVPDVLNYVAAMEHGLARLEALPLSRRLLCEVHEVLMRNVRGGEPGRTPGRFRSSQVWIGGPSPATARFVPPPAGALGGAFAEFERYLHDPTPVPILVKAGLAHAQFETLHPFFDGNGRVGRLLITFLLKAHNVLSLPIFYPSVFLKRNRDDYIERLQGIRERGAWEEWLAFFLDGVAQVAVEAADRAGAILRLQMRDRARITAECGRRAPNGLLLLDTLFGKPAVSAAGVVDRIGVSQPTASALLGDLERLGILQELTGKKRDRVYAYREYLDLFPGATERR